MRLLGIIIFILHLLLLPPGLVQAETLFLNQVRTELYFSPKGGAEAAIVQAINQARRELCVLAYSFTSLPINAALEAAYQRKLRVIVILDRSQLAARGSKLRNLQEAGLPVFIDSTHAIAHNKVMIIDKRRIITGSFNFTRAAEERNAENLLIMDNKALSKRYMQDFERHLEHASPAPLEMPEEAPEKSLAP